MSDARPDFVAELRAADEKIAEDALRESRAKAIFRELQLRRVGEGPRRRLLFVASAVAAGVAVGLLAMWLLAGRETHVGGFAVTQRSMGFESELNEGVMSVSAGEATLVDPALRLQVHVGQGARLRRETGGLRVVSGEASFVAEKRGPSEPPARVLVSGGAIEVIGTRFTVKQSGDSGELVLYEGVVRFVVSDGRIVAVLPGEAFRWPVPKEPPMASPDLAAPAAVDAGVAVPPPALAVPDDAPPSAPKAEDDWSVHDRLLRARVVLEEVPKLREAGKGRQALFRIRDALAHDLPQTTREQLFAWEAEILEDDLDQSDAACRQWREYMWLFPGGRFEAHAKIELKNGCK